MKHTFPILTLLFALAISFNACNSRVDLYADYKDIPIIYGLLDYTQDTNFVKIIRAYSNNNENPIEANVISLIADSSNYPGKLDARLIELERTSGNNYSPTGREIVLDTITLHHKESGDFYYPNQKIYYTAERLKNNSNNHTYKYHLQVLKGDDTISSTTGMVGGSDFEIVGQNVIFSPDSPDSRTLTIRPAQNAYVYSAKMKFEYTEKAPGHPLEYKSVEWSLGYYPASEIQIENGTFKIKYAENTLFNHLRVAIGNNTNNNVERYIGNFTVSVAAGGDELYNYIEINSQSGGLSQNVPDYTNINGGFGIFSSRVNLEKKMNLSANTQVQLIGMEGWNFHQQ